MKPTSVAKTIAVWAGAIIAVSTIVSWVSSYTWSRAIDPVLEAVAAEHDHHTRADSLLTYRLRQLSRDRIDMVDILMTRDEKIRHAKLQLLRDRWLSEP